MRITLVSYYWPPSGGSGVQRWLKFVKYLSQMNHEVEVITPSKPDFDLKDDSLLEEIPKSVKIHHLPIWEPLGWYKKLRGGKLDSNKLGDQKRSLITKLTFWIRGNFFIPDPRIFWVRKTRKYIARLSKERPFDVLVTTGPPHSMHLIALGLKKRNFKFIWLADFRDTWSQIDFLQEFYTSKVAMQIHRKLEKNVLKNADLVTTVNDQTAKLLAKRYDRKINIVYNGFDPADFSGLNKTVDKKEFEIVHFGLLNKLRNPGNLWTALEEICREDSVFREKLRIKLGGVIEDDIIRRLESSPELSQAFNNCGYVSHKEVIQHYFNADLLLLLLNNTELGKTVMTGKVYEYLMAEKPILGMGYTQSDPAKLVSRAASGKFFEYSDKEALKGYIIDVFNNTYDFSPKSEVIRSLTREENTKLMITLIEQFKKKQT